MGKSAVSKEKGKYPLRRSGGGGGVCRLCRGNSGGPKCSFLVLLVSAPFNLYNDGINVFFFSIKSFEGIF